jgi:hypothetical protein
MCLFINNLAVSIKMPMNENFKRRQERMGMNVDRPIVHKYVKKTEPGITLRADRDAVKARARDHFAAIKVAPASPHIMFPKRAEKKPMLKTPFDVAAFLKNKYSH